MAQLAGKYMYLLLYISLSPNMAQEESLTPESKIVMANPRKKNINLDLGNTLYVYTR